MRNTYRPSSLWIAVTMLGIASGQTKVDLTNQTKSVDFSAAPSTKPFQTGTTLPATCGIGQMFFVTSAPSGQNTYGCVAADTWVPQFGISTPGPTGSTGPVGATGPAGATGTPGSTGTVIGVMFNGTTVTAGSANLTTDNSTIASTTSVVGSVITNSFSAGPATALNATLQSGGSPLTFNTSSSSGTTYVAFNSNYALPAYSAGQVLYWVVGTTSTSTTPAINISTLGAKTITDYQGSPLAVGALVNGATIPITYDGTQIRCMTCGLSSSGGGGSSVLPASQGNTGALTVGTGSTTIYSTASVPPLAAGSCYEIIAAVGGPAAITHEYIAVDGVPVFDLDTSGGANAYYSQAWLYCNDAGVQTTQHLTYLYGGYNPSNTGSAYTPYTQTTPYAPASANVNWASGHTVSLSVVATSASTLTGLSWRVTQ